MKKETLHPDFFTLDDRRIIEIKPVMPMVTGKRSLKQTLGSLTPMMTIPTYTLYKEGSRKRKQLEKAYSEEKLKKYNEIKKIYDDNVYLGAVFCATNGVIRMHTPIDNSEHKRSCKITKIFIDDKNGVGYVCYKASDEHIEWVNKQNEIQKAVFYKNKKKRSGMSLPTPLKPIASGKFGLITFISALHESNSYLKIIKNPNKK